MQIDIHAQIVSSRGTDTQLLCAVTSRTAELLNAYDGGLLPPAEAV